MTESQQQSELVMKKFGPISDSPPAGEQQGDPTEDSPAEAPEPTLSPRELTGQQLDELVERMRSNQTGWLAHFGYPYAERRFRNLRDNGKELQREFAKLTDDHEEVLEFQTKVSDLEASYNRSHFRLVAFPTTLVVGCAIVGIGIAIHGTGLLDWIQDKLEIKRLMRFVFLALAGAALYMSTSLIGDLSPESETKRQRLTVWIVIMRFLVALVVATILVMLTFKKSGAPLKLAQMWKSPEMLSFVCGYSANLIVLAANKFVEKISTMIKAL